LSSGLGKLYQDTLQQTAKPIPTKTIESVKEKAASKATEVDEARKAHLSLQRRLAAVERGIKKSDEISENVTVTDFEQLKIETQALKENLAKNEEELSGHQKKLVRLVHFKAHFQAKISNLKTAKDGLESEFEKIGEFHKTQRLAVIEAKKSRAEIQAATSEKKKKLKISKNEGLTRDFGKNEEKTEKLRAEISALKMI